MLFLNSADRSDFLGEIKMNRIFKKIWNRHRGCFVAVSEAMTAAGQRAGKATVVVGTVGLMFSGLVQATE